MAREKVQITVRKLQKMGGRKRMRDKTEKSAPVEVKVDAIPGADTLSRGQRKRRKHKKDNQELLSKLVQGQQQRTETASTFGNLFTDALSASLRTTSTRTKSRKQKSLTTRQKERLGRQELSQFRSVLVHPQFQAQPLQTLQEHLELTVQTVKPVAANTEAESDAEESKDTAEQSTPGSERKKVRKFKVRGK